MWEDSLHSLIDNIASVSFLKIFIYLFLAALALWYRAWAFSNCGEQGLLFTVVHSLLIAVASLGWSTGSRCAGFSSCSMHALECVGSIDVVHGLSCSTACGIFLDQGLNSCPLHWQVDSQPLDHQGRPLNVL